MSSSDAAINDRLHISSGGMAAVVLWLSSDGWAVALPELGFPMSQMTGAQVQPNPSHPT